MICLLNTLFSSHTRYGIPTVVQMLQYYGCPVTAMDVVQDGAGKYPIVYCAELCKRPEHVFFLLLRTALVWQYKLHVQDDKHRGHFKQKETLKKNPYFVREWTDSLGPLKVKSIAKDLPTVALQRRNKSERHNSDSLDNNYDALQRSCRDGFDLPDSNEVLSNICRPISEYM